MRDRRKYNEISREDEEKESRKKDLKKRNWQFNFSKGHFNYHNGRYSELSDSYYLNQVQIISSSLDIEVVSIDSSYSEFTVFLYCSRNDYKEFFNQFIQKVKHIEDVKF